MKSRSDNPFAGHVPRADLWRQHAAFASALNRTDDAIYAASIAYFTQRNRIRYRRFWNTSPRNEYGTPGQVAYRARKIKRQKMVRVR